MQKLLNWKNNHEALFLLDDAVSYLMGDLEKVLLEETYTTSVDNLFDILFGDDNEFMADFWKKGDAYGKKNILIAKNCLVIS